MTARARSARQVRGRDGGIGIPMSLDGMNSMTVGAHRGLAVAAGNRLPVNTLHEFLPYRVVTLGAGRRHVETENRRMIVTGRENLVGAVAIGADGSFFRSSCDRLTVDALQIRGEGLGAMTARFHDVLLSVTASASCRNIRMADARLGITRRQ